MGESVVHEGAGDRPQAVGGVRVLGGRLGEGGPQLVEVADEGEREELLLAGEVPVDDGAVDADGPGDVLDLGVPDAALVEQGAGGRDDLPLPRPAPQGGGRPATVGLRGGGLCAGHALEGTPAEQSWHDRRTPVSRLFGHAAGGAEDRRPPGQPVSSTSAVDATVPRRPGADAHSQ